MTAHAIRASLLATATLTLFGHIRFCNDFIHKLESKFKGCSHQYYKEIEKKHGRYDIRQYWILDAPDTLHRIEKREGLQSIGMVQRESTVGDKTTTETRYFINSIQADAKMFAKGCA